MATRNRRVQVASSDQSVGLNVHAPSAVYARSAAAEQADILADALGFASDAYAQKVQRDNKSDMERGAKDAAMEGFTDEALHGMDESNAYVMGAQKMIARSKIIEDAAAANEWYAAEFDKGKSLEDLRSGLNDFWRNRYEGVSTGLAREIAPLMADTSNGIIKQHAQFQAEESHKARVEEAATVIDHALETGTYDHEAFRTESNAVLGKPATNALIAQRAVAFAERTLDETVLDRPEFKMLRDNPTFKDDLNAAYADVKKARISAHERAAFQQQAKSRAELTLLADEGHPSVPALIEAAARPDENGRVLLEDEEKVLSMYLRYANGVQKENLQPINTDLWATSNARFLKTNKERDASALAYSEQVHAKILAETGDPEKAEQGALAELITSSVSNNYIPEPLKQVINVSPRNPEAFAKAVDIVDQLEAQQPGLAGRQANGDFLRDRAMYKRLVLELGDPEKALEELTNSDPTVWKSLPKARIAQSKEEVIEDLNDGPLWFGTGINTDSDRLYAMVEEDLQYYVSRGMPLEHAKEMAVNNLKPGNRTVVVEGEIYRTGEGWTGDQTVMDNAANLAKVNYALEAGQDQDDVAILPVPNKPGYVRIGLKGPLAYLGTMTTVPISKVMEDYAKSVQAVAKVAAGEREADAVARAKESLFPTPKGDVLGARAYFAKEEQEKRWNALTSTQQAELLARTRR